MMESTIVTYSANLMEKCLNGNHESMLHYTLRIILIECLNKSKLCPPQEAYEKSPALYYTQVL